VRYNAERKGICSVRLLHILCPILTKFIRAIKSLDEQLNLFNDVELSEGHKPDVTLKIERLREQVMTLHRVSVSFKLIH
jgi:hypothetical protein